MRVALIAIRFALVGNLTYLLPNGDAEGAFYPTIGLTSDYRYNGISYSDGDPVPQVSLYWTVPQHLYIGLWYSEIYFKDPGRTSTELDLYAGRDFQLRKYRVTFEALYTAFPDKDFPGPTYNFVQLKIRARRSFGEWTIGMQTAWTPEASYRSGPATRVSTELNFEPKPWITLGANFGRRWVGSGADRTYWDAGIMLKRRKVGFDIRYTDTNLDPAQCRLRCDAAITGTVSINLW